MKKAFLCCIGLLLLGRRCSAQNKAMENDLKAAFIYNFTKYIEWPAIDDNGDFIVGIVGTSGLDTALLEIAKNFTVRNRRIIIRHFDPENIRYCHVLVIGRENKIPVGNILNQVDKGVLTIGEEAGLAQQGTGFDFMVSGDKIKFEANVKALADEGLKVSSQLLKLAILVNQKTAQS